MKIKECFLNEEAPQDLDYCMSNNLYEAKYGQDWQDHIKTCFMLNPNRCITHMVEHIVKESSKFFKETKYEETWCFYHDALSLMTGKETVKWMKEKDYYKYWLIPTNNLQWEDDLKSYHGQPVGDCPELMTWDCSLNNGLHLIVC